MENLRMVYGNFRRIFRKKVTKTFNEISAPDCKLSCDILIHIWLQEYMVFSSHQTTVQSHFCLEGRRKVSFSRRFSGSGPHRGEGPDRCDSSAHQRLAFTVNDVMGNMSYLRNEWHCTAGAGCSWNWLSQRRAEHLVGIYGRDLLPTGVGWNLHTLSLPISTNIFQFNFLLQPVDGCSVLLGRLEAGR